MKRAPLTWRARFISVTGGMQTCCDRELASGKMTYEQWRKANVAMYVRVTNKKVALLEKSDGNN